MRYSTARAERRHMLEMRHKWKGSYDRRGNHTAKNELREIEIENEKIVNTVPEQSAGRGVDSNFVTIDISEGKAYETSWSCNWTDGIATSQGGDWARDCIGGDRREQECIQTSHRTTRRKERWTTRSKATCPTFYAKKPGKVNKDKQHIARDRPPQRVDHLLD